ncbi:MAG: sugar transferase [Candidatus Saccharibacteria bacterium]|nr:sugar transferase [Pseudorhodobacter sp.]
MTLTKRLVDLILATALAVLIAVPFGILILYLLWKEGRPVFYVAERMRAPGQPFALWKLRTMTVVRAEVGVSGGNKTGRITPTGRFLRRTRLDEVPQLYNVLKGDMSFVGPRPPLRPYVERFPEIYAKVLQSRPGITGLATLVYHRHEEKLLAQCQTAAETDAVYARRCVPRKAHIDLIYQRRRTLWMDFRLMALTLARALKISK